MPLEVLCSRCQGRLRVEQTGVVVACPHCGAHLMIPASGPAAAPKPVAPPAAPEPTPPWMVPPQKSPAPAGSGFPMFDFQAAPTSTPAASASAAVAAPNPVASAPQAAPSFPFATPESPAAATPPSPMVNVSVPEAPFTFDAPTPKKASSGPAFDFLSSPSAAPPTVASVAAASPAIETPAANETPAAEQAHPTAAAKESESLAPPSPGAAIASPSETAAVLTPDPNPEALPEVDLHLQSPTAPPTPVGDPFVVAPPSFPAPIAEPQSPEAASAAQAAVEAAVVAAEAAQLSTASSSPQNLPTTSDQPLFTETLVEHASEAVEAPLLAGKTTGEATPPISAAISATAPLTAASVPGWAGGETAPFAASVAPISMSPPSESLSVAREDSSGVSVLNESLPAKVAPRRPSVPQLWFVIVLSYASAVTLMLIYTIYQTRKAAPSTLESLPDVVPELSSSGQVRQKFVEFKALMPAGHTLKLGETQRYGDLKVTPVRVTREPLSFVRFDDPTQTRLSDEKILKLWLRFENVSSEFSFPPLGKVIVYNRYKRPGNQFQEISNQFVTSLENKKNNGPVVLLYPHVVQDVWDLKGQEIDLVLKPGQSFETYLPSDTEGVDKLDGELVWRVHLRKGVNAKSRRGVTTLFEVVFDSSAIEESKG